MKQMGNDKKKYKFNPVTNEKYLFEDLPVRSQWGIKNMEHNCFKCGKHVDKQEATDSSIYIRMLCDGESPYLWDVWVSDFCSQCAHTFKTFGEFVNFIREHKNNEN